MESITYTVRRIDGDYADGRHPDEVSFTSNLEEDLLRRDFTMNAIAYHPAEGFRDPFGGQEDISRSLIRGVGEPAKRFQEDALRMLRAVRFSAQLGFQVDDATYTALQENAALIEKISVERIHEELDKLWKSPFPEKLSLLLSSGLLPHIDNLLDKRLTALGETLVPQLKAAPISAPLRWTLVLQSFTEAEAKTFCKKLKFDNATAKQIQTYLRHLSQPIPQTPYEVRKLAGILGVEPTENLFILQEILQDKAAVQAAREILGKVLSDGDCLNLKMLEMDGKALMDAGIPAGKAVGETLGLLLEDVLHQPEHNKREYLLEKALAFQQK